VKKKTKKNFKETKEMKKVEQYVLEEIKGFDFKLLKYFGKEDVCCRFLKYLQKKLKHK